MCSQSRLKVWQQGGKKWEIGIGYKYYNPTAHCSGYGDGIPGSELHFFLIVDAFVRSSQCSFHILNFLHTRTEGERSFVSVGLSSLNAYKKTNAWRDTWNFHVKPLKYNLWFQDNHPNCIFVLLGLAIPLYTKKCLS